MKSMFKSSVPSIAAMFCVFLAATSSMRADSDGDHSKYQLTVGSGQGGGYYYSGACVRVSAYLPPYGQMFEKWDGSGATYLKNKFVSQTTLAMPSKAVWIEAHYKKIPSNLYVLTVNGGSGSGSYKAATQVSISAKIPAGTCFSEWIGDVCNVWNIYDPTTYICMPDSATTITAVFKEIPPTLYKLTVDSGSGSGDYKTGTVVRIVANQPATGYYFDQWTGDIDTVENVRDPDTTLNMPSKNAAVKAVYLQIPPENHQLNVEFGSGSGRFTPGATAPISADTPPAGKLFDRWIGQADVVENPELSDTVVYMPDADVTVTATYKDIPVVLYALTVDSGRGSGSYTAGAVVSISADNPPTGKYFSGWTGQTETIASVSSPDTTLTMPTRDTAIAASYKDIPPLLFQLTVNSGSGSGLFSPGTEVRIVANPPEVGYCFLLWDGQTSAVENINDFDTILRMPSSDTTVTATYSEIPPQFFDLGVILGTGTGSYQAGTVVPISANAPSTGQLFDKWVGQTATVENVNLAQTTLTMPASNTAVAASYKTAPPTLFALSITSGSGSGSYAAGTPVNIVANSPPDGKRFAKWAGQTATIQDVFSASTILSMPSQATAVTATYETAPPPTYSLFVNNGSGSGSYTVGQTVPVSATPAPAGQIFSAWTGDIAAVVNPSLANTTIKMPAATTTITATYKALPPAKYMLTVSSGSGSGEYQEGAAVMVSANPPPEGQMFAGWTGQTETMDNPNLAQATLTMPAYSAAILATYKAVPTVFFKLTVNRGSGSGSFSAGTRAPIAADSPAAGMRFAGWTGSSFIEKPLQPSTVVIMPDADATVTATYEKIAPTPHTLIVKSGSGSGSYIAGTLVPVSADFPPAGQYFSRWAGQTATMADPNKSDTTLRMPAYDTAVEAVYEPIPPTFFLLSVTYGSGSGQYTAGTRVPIAADIPPEGKRFAGWTGQTAQVENPTAPNTIVTIATADTAVTATYADIPPVLYKLLVVSGSGSGLHIAGSIVPISADPPPDGYYFSRWTGDDFAVEDPRLPETTATMPDRDIIVRAMFEKIPPTAFDLTVRSGSGSGSYQAGATVSVEANPPPAGQYFAYWDGQTATMDSILLPQTTLVMPSRPITVEAVYKTLPPTLYPLAVAHGSGSGQYQVGTVVRISADPAPQGTYFVCWDGQTATISDIRLPDASLAMPNHSVSVNAVYNIIPPYLFNLTVVHGEGSGTYKAGTSVQISAEPAGTGKCFAYWDGQTATVDNIYLANTTLTMPKYDATVVAVYKSISTVLYNLTVSSGWGAGSYMAGTSIRVAAYPPASGKYFVCWTGDTATLDNPEDSDTTFSMPSADAEIMATYADIPPVLYNLTVTDGTGAGGYMAGTRVNVSANPPPEGKFFVYWDGDTETMDNDHSADAILIMPGHNVKIAAIYQSIPPTLYTLSVTSGKGSGIYISGTRVPVSADTPPAGQIFAKWEGQTETLDNPRMPDTAVTMPAQSVSIRATYQAAPPTLHTLSVINGSGSGKYTAGTSVPVAAKTPPAGQFFVQWIGDTDALEDPLEPETTLRMPDRDASVAATYADIPPTLYALTVQRGAGTGQYEAGVIVDISAEPALEGYFFAGWTGYTSTIENPKDAETTLRMPALAVTVSASYLPVPPVLFSLTVENGSGSGTFAAGAFAPISANSPSKGMRFAAWKGQTETVKNTTQSDTFLRMPPSDITVTATYTDIPPTLRKLTVVEGAGSGEYQAGTIVPISATNPPEGYYFSFWTGQTATIASIHDPETTLAMPDSDVSIAANFAPIPPKLFVLKVTDGSGSGSFDAGANTAVSANPPPEGQCFDYWDGQTATLENIYQSVTLLRMPAHDVSITAIFKTVPLSLRILTVSKGSGSGTYSVGSSVPVKADTAPEGYYFTRWTGQTSTMDNPTLPQTTLAMPDHDTYIEALYVTLPPALFTLKVVSGSGSGLYTAGTNVLVKANTPPSGQLFSIWIGQTEGLDDIHDASTVMRMTSHAATIQAMYAEIPPTLFSLTVGKGTGSGSYTAGSNVSIQADVPSKGYCFSKWVGNVEAVENPLDPHTTLAMPPRDTWLSASYAPVPPTLYSLTVSAGAGSGNYAVGTPVAVIADTPPAGQYFAAWTGDIDFVEDPAASSTVLRMPAANAAITATFKPTPPTLFRLSVVGGSGTGDYQSGTAVLVAANPPPEGQYFTGWTGQTWVVEDPRSPETVVQIPAEDIAIAASYASLPPAFFTLTVLQGSGSGSYQAGATAQISANTPSAGYYFMKWNDPAGIVVNTLAPATAVRMPGADAAVEAVFQQAPPTLFTLTVKSGTGTGSYQAGTTVSIVANDAPAGQYFLKWTGDTTGIVDTRNAATIIRMPAANAAVAAAYAPIPPTLYALGVAAGTGAGRYQAGTTVSIAANAPAAGMMFAAWIGQTSTVANVNNAATTLIMPAQDIAVAAAFAAVPPTLFKLTVTDGMGSGGYPAGTTIPIAAITPPPGYYFVVWSGDTAYLANPSDPTTTVVMPARDIAVIAEYTAIMPTSYSLTVTSGTGSGSYPAGTTVSIAANAPPAGQYFLKWTGDTTGIEDTRDATTVIRVPAANVAIAAAYAPIPPNLYALGVTSGAGAGRYQAGTVVAIAANTPPAGMMFASWIGQTSTVANAANATTTLTMPAQDIAVAASFAVIPPTQFTLTVTSGTGTGRYIAGTIVPIAANTAPDGQYFVRWAGDTAYMANPADPTTTVVMPARSIAATAEYAAIPSVFYDLTVTSGTGTGRYKAGATVNIAANAPPAGQYFLKWTGDTTGIEDTRDATTVIRMPAANAAIAAVYAPIPPTLYALGVTSGTGAGRYQAGTVVDIAANSPPDGMMFVSWTGQISTVANVANSATTLIMPTQDIAVAAAFAAIPPTLFTLTVTDGMGAGSYQAGTIVAIAADSPPEGCYFVNWTGDVECLANPADPTTTVVMPVRDIAVAAAYAAIPSTRFDLSVANGSGSGSYQVGTSVQIEAGTPPAGYYFVVWTGQTDTVEDVRSPATTLSMPAASIFVEATYQAVPPTLFELAVSNGSGSGMYSAGALVPIIANTPSKGKLFAVWAGGGSYIADVLEPDTVLRMPSSALSIAAMYRDAPPTHFDLTVVNGSGSAMYVSGAMVKVAAAIPPPGKAFDKWTGDIEILLDSTTPGTIAAMSNRAAVITATYKDATPGVNYLTVVDGTGSGPLLPGAAARVAANLPPAGMVFSAWTGDTANLLSTTSQISLLLMPEGDAALIATYTPAPAGWRTLTVVEGSGSGTYPPGAKITIQADAPPYAKRFLRWLGAAGDVIEPNVANTILTMPDVDTVVDASYISIPDGWHSLAVQDGSGDGAYQEGACVPIFADTPPAGKRFTVWAGDISALINPYTPYTYAVIPSWDVELQAVYTDLTADTPVLAVVNGVAAGGFQLGFVMDIAAGQPPYGTIFSEWVGNAACLLNPRAPQTMLVPPGANTSVLAVFAPPPSSLRQLAVLDGSGGGYYLPGAKVPLHAEFKPGKKFDQWKGDIGILDNPLLIAPTATMPDANAALAPVYLDSTYAQLAIEVIGGGATSPQGGRKPVPPDWPVVVNAWPSPGFVFAGWTNAEGSNASIFHPARTDATVYIHDSATIKANFATETKIASLRLYASNLPNASSLNLTFAGLPKFNPTVQDTAAFVGRYGDSDGAMIPFDKTLWKTRNSTQFNYKSQNVRATYNNLKGTLQIYANRLSLDQVVDNPADFPVILRVDSALYGARPVVAMKTQWQFSKVNSSTVNYGEIILGILAAGGNAYSKQPLSGQLNVSRALATGLPALEPDDNIMLAVNGWAVLAPWSKFKKGVLASNGPPCIRWQIQPATGKWSARLSKFTPMTTDPRFGMELMMAVGQPRLGANTVYGATILQPKWRINYSYTAPRK